MSRVTWSPEQRAKLHTFLYKVDSLIDEFDKHPERMIEYFYKVEGRQIPVGGVEFNEKLDELLDKLKNGQFMIKV